MRKRILAAAVTAATLASGVQAAGFYLKEQSVVGQGRAFAGSAAGTDGASAAYFNPAGTVGLDRQVEVGVHLISPDVTVTNNGTAGGNTGGGTINTIKPYEAKPVPNFHFVNPLDESTSISVAIGAPYGFSNDYGINAFSRLDNVKVDLATIELSASIAKQITEETALSFGLVYQSMDVEQVFGAGAPGTETTQAGDGTATGFVIGVQHAISDATKIGASYRTQNTVELSGTLSGGSFGAGVSFDADFELPSIFAIGLQHNVSDRTRAYVDATYYGWSAYERLTAVSPTSGTPIVSATNNYNDTISFGLGAEHDYGNGLTVRAGIHIDPTPTNDTDRSTSTPDSDRTWLATGFSKEMSEDLIFDAALTHIIADDGKINKTTLGGAQVQANVESSVNILSLGLRYKF